MSVRQVILDTETTGLDPKKGHRIIEIGCIEMTDRKITDLYYHEYIDPQRDIDQGAVSVHGITSAFLKGKPLFKHIIHDFLNFIKDSQLIIHNAPFDVGFIENELRLVDKSFGTISDYCSVLDTLTMARKKFPGQKNSLDALCKRFNIDNSNRDLHGALLDAKLLAMVYLSMTGGQGSFFEKSEDELVQNAKSNVSVHPVLSTISIEKPNVIIKATTDELQLHQEKLIEIKKMSHNQCVWDQE